MRRAAALVFVAVLALSVAPASTASHDGGGGQLVPDGFVTLTTAENAVEEDNSIIVSPQDGDYVFNVQLLDDSGNAVDFGSLGWAIFTVDALEENNISVADVAENPDDYSRFSEATGTSDNPEGDDVDEFRVPTSALGFGSVVPDNGVAVFAWAQDKDTNGGAVSLAAQQHAKEGNWEEADEADQQWTPVFVHTTDADALVEPNQPVFNPDFTVGDTTGQEVESPTTDSGTGNTVAAPTAAPPWYAHVTEPGQFPESSTQLVAVDGGLALQVNVDGSDIQDADDKLYIGQQFSDATEAFEGRQDESPIPLKWADPGQLEVDVRLPEDTGAKSVDVSIIVEWASDAGEGRITESKTKTLLASDTFETLTIDFDEAEFDSHPDRNLSRVMMKIDANEDTGSLADGFPIQFDDARLRGADHQPVTMHSSISDGYAVHIEPVDTSDLDRDRNQVEVDAFETIEDKRYLFEVTVWDTRQDKKVDPAEFDAESFQVGRADPATGDTSAGGQFDFTYLDSKVTSLDFVDDKSRLVVLDASEIPEDTTTSAWYWAQIEDGTPPQDGAGYYSIVKNQFEGKALSDQLDWAANPVQFTNVSADSYTFESRVADFTNDRDVGTSSVTVASDSPVLEPLTVNLLDSDGTVVASKVSAPVAEGQPDTVEFDTAIPENGAAQVEAGEVTESSQLDLGPPEVDVGTLPTDIDDGTGITLPVDTLMDPDPDPAITSAQWHIEVDTVDGVVTDTVEVSDENGDGTIDASEATVDGYLFPDNGSATVTLTAEDNDGDVGSDSVSTVVDNAPPTFESDFQVIAANDVIISPDSGDGVWEVQAGAEIDLRSSADDPSAGGEIVAGSMELEGTNVTVLADEGTRLAEDNVSRSFDLMEGLMKSYTPAGPGEYDVTVTWTDDDGDTITTSAVIDATNPTAEETASDVNATFGGEVAGDVPLAGEVLETTLEVTYTGDRPDVAEDLVLVDPAGNVVDEAVTTKAYDQDLMGKRMAATYTITAPTATAGTYTLELDGTTFTGASLADTFNRTLDVAANADPAAALDFPNREAASDGLTYAEIGENVGVLADGSDADCADGGPRCQLSFDWSLVTGAGDLSEDGNASVVTPTAASADASTPHEVEVTVTDHLGGTSTTTIPLVVDDRLELKSIDVRAQGDAADGEIGVSGQVTDDLDDGQDALLDYVVRYSPNRLFTEQGVQHVVDRGQVQLPADGTFDIDFDDETAGYNLAGHYEVTLTAQEPIGRIDRPDQDPNSDGSGTASDTFEETVTGVFAKSFDAGQAAGTAVVEADGKCTYDGEGGEDSARIVVEGDRIPPHAIEYPASGQAQAALTACGQAPLNGDSPGGGSHAGVSVSFLGQSFEVSTVPVTDALTENAPGAGAATVASIQAEGACHADGSGASDDGGVSVATSGVSADGPDSGAVQEAATACAGGGGPGGGSYLAAGASAAEGAVDADANTVPVTDLATGQESDVAAGAQAEGACYGGGSGAEDTTSAEVDTEGPIPPHSVVYPDTGAAETAILACLDAASAGETPGGGSHLTVTSSAAGQEATVSTVPVTDTLTGLGVP